MDIIATQKAFIKFGYLDPPITEKRVKEVKQEEVTNA